MVRKSCNSLLLSSFRISAAGSNLDAAQSLLPNLDRIRPRISSSNDSTRSKVTCGRLPGAPGGESTGTIARVRFPLSLRPPSSCRSARSQCRADATRYTAAQHRYCGAIQPRFPRRGADRRGSPGSACVFTPSNRNRPYHAIVTWLTHLSAACLLESAPIPPLGLAPSSPFVFFPQNAPAPAEQGSFRGRGHHSPSCSFDHHHFRWSPTMRTRVRVSSRYRLGRRRAAPRRAGSSLSSAFRAPCLDSFGFLQPSTRSQDCGRRPLIVLRLQSRSAPA